MQMNVSQAWERRPPVLTLSKGLVGIRAEQTLSDPS